MKAATLAEYSIRQRLRDEDEIATLMRRKINDRQFVFD
jgi:hypothetical protein